MSAGSTSLRWPPAAWLAVLGTLAAGVALYGTLAAAPPAQTVMAAYTTSLRERTRAQRHNAALAARALDGAVIRPGRTLSFNGTVRSWSADQGYVKAPVSYDGEMVRAFGGGVCQTSSTLYNAALLAGLTIVERHRHAFAAHYVAPGRDAAVAYPGVDLRLRNPYRWPVRIDTQADGEELEVRIVGARKPADTIRVETEVLSVERPDSRTVVVRATNGATGRSFLRNPGAVGYHVRTVRVFERGGGVRRRELLGDDTYPAMDRAIAFMEDE